MSNQVMSDADIQIRLQTIVRNYCDFQSYLVTSRKELARELFETCKIDSDLRFKQIKNFLMDAYKSNFIRTSYYAALIPEGLTIYGKSAYNDMFFYEEGCKLAKLNQRLKKKG